MRRNAASHHEVPRVQDFHLKVVMAALRRETTGKQADAIKGIAEKAVRL